MKSFFPLLLVLISPFVCPAQDMLKGAIDSAYFFHAKISEQGEKLSGRYRYDNHDEWIDLDGSINPATGEFTLYEYVNDKGQRTKHSVFTGIKDGVFMEGSWVMLDGKNQRRPFYFTQDTNPDVRTKLCSSKIFFGNKTRPTSQGKIYTLIRDDSEGVGSVVWFDQAYRDRFTIEFEYQTWDDDGEEDLNSTNSADGVSLILFQDKQVYAAKATDIPGGGAMGFVENGSGLAVKFVLYSDRKIQIVSNKEGVLAEQSAQTMSQFTAASTRPWSTVSVSVKGTQLTVVLDEGEPLTATIPAPTQNFLGFGIGAGTGAADALHRVKNVRITK